jgi:hypothetical protein
MPIANYLLDAQRLVHLPAVDLGIIVFYFAFVLDRPGRSHG